MRTTFPFGSRPAPYDRNPALIRVSYTAEAAPHGTTVRWSYTVPNGRKAILLYLAVRVQRTAAPTTAGRPQAYIALTPSGGPALTVLLAQLLSATTGELDRAEVGTSALMLPGDVLAGITLDTSTGGTVAYSVVGILNEFDA